MIRIMIVLRIINVYEVFCIDNEIKMLFRVTLYKIIKVCSVLQRKFLKGFDSYIIDGMEVMDLFQKILYRL